MEEKEFAPEKKSSAGFWIIVSILAILGCAALGYLYSKKNGELAEANKTIAQQDQEMNDMNLALGDYIDGETNDLRQDFQSMLETYDALIEKDASLADSLNEQKSQILALQEELSTNKRRSFREINKFKDENAQLRRIMKNYLVQIDSLNTLNIDLTDRLDKKTNELTTVSKERDEAQQAADENAALVQQGSKLNAYNFNTIGLKYKSGGGTSETNRARRADLISSTFTLSANKIAKAERKTVYMQIIDPTGKTLYSKSNNTIAADGKTIVYSDKREVDYQKQQVDITIFYDFPEGFEAEKGNYTVKIFADGTFIGKDSFTLK